MHLKSSEVDPVAKGVKRAIGFCGAGNRDDEKEEDAGAGGCPDIEDG